MIGRLIPLFGKTRDKFAARDFHDELAIDVLARTMWGEARGEGSIGMQTVAQVIMNRVRVAQSHDGYWWGNNVVQVCQKPYQFSCWNKDDPNYRQVIAVDDKDLHFVTARRIARRVYYNTVDDITEGATHYHARGITPYWAKNEKPVTVIGSHIFYQLVEPKVTEEA